MRILVTGGAGYVGSVLIPFLIEKGHSIICLDRFFFGKDYLSQKQFQDKITLVQDDIRWFDPSILKNVDVVMDLAALSNDPVGELDPEKTFEINHRGRARVADLSKKAGVPQYILASSASIYGKQDDIVNETSKVNPITAYSQANRKAEISALELNDDNFCVTALRFSSILGVSPRMRFDIAVNSMVLDVFKNKKIVVHGKSNRRPFLHIKDAVRAYDAVLQSDKNKISGEIFNVGSNDKNFDIGSLAELIVKTVSKDAVLDLGDTHDHRSYVTSFDKINTQLGYDTKFSIEEGIREIFTALKNGDIDDSIKTITLEWYQHLIDNPAEAKNVLIDGKLL